MIDYIEIHNLIKELRSGEATAFYIFNEIKNILLEQKEFTQLEALVTKLMEELQTQEKEVAVPLWFTTDNARLNRLVIYYSASIIENYDEHFYKTVWKILYDPFTKMPLDSFEALREVHFDFGLNESKIDALIETKQWEKLSFLAKELSQLPYEQKLLYKEKLQVLIPRETTREYHGLEISTFDAHSILEALATP